MDQNTKKIFDWKAIAIEELGMGKRTENAAKRLGIQTAEDLLYHFPYSYEAYPVPLPVYQIPEGPAGDPCDLGSVSGLFWKITQDTYP